MEIRVRLSEKPFAPRAALPLQQHPAYGRALSRLGRESRAAVIEDAGGLAIGRAQLIVRRGAGAGLALLSRGPVWQGDPCPATRAAALGRLHRALDLGPLSALVINAEAPAEAEALRRAGALALLTPAHIAEWDLSQPPEALRAAMDGKWRNRLAAAGRGPLKIQRSVFRGPAGHWLLTREAAQAKARGYRGLPPGFLAAYGAANPGGAQLFCAMQGGTAVAAMLFLRHGSAATYQTGWAGPEGRALSAHNLILWRAARWLARQGVTRLDLGTLDTETAPGLARFKMGTGAALRPLGGTWAWQPGLAPILRGARAALRALVPLPARRTGEKTAALFTVRDGGRPV